MVSAERADASQRAQLIRKGDLAPCAYIDVCVLTAEIGRSIKREEVRVEFGRRAPNSNKAPAVYHTSADSTCSPRAVLRAVHADILDDSRRVVGLTSLHCASEEPHREDVLRAGWTTVEREFPSSDTLLESPATAGSKHYAHAEQVAPRLASSRATRARVRASSS